MFEIGPFRLDKPLGRGGMGQVWSGRHARFGYPVAVKFLTAKTVQKRGFLEAFRTEVRLVAGLDHPAVVQVYDYGESDQRTAQATGDRIPTGTPWLAMELVAGGTLAPLGGKLGWPELEAIARSLLGALGHAHARGVIHRDLKPGNVLVSSREPGRALEIKLTDFGLASTVEAQETVDGGPFAGGTPAYMSPEQFEARWRDFGPWTDLYGAGCLLWSMVRGAPPFGPTSSVEEKRRQHLEQPPPPLDPPVSVPEGLEGWLRTLLEKDPARRFRRAADALAALEGLGPPATQPTSDPSLTSSHFPTLIFGEGKNTEPTRPLDLPRPAGGHLAIGASGPPAAPLPVDWRGPADLASRSELPSSGLGLFGLKPPPLVDRQDERERLWGALRRVHREGAARAVVLSGAAGAGKSRLAEWLCQRAHETGAAQVLRATHSLLPGPTHGLGPMLRATLRCQGLDREGVRRRVEAIFSAHGVGRPDEWEALTEVIHPAPEGAEGRIRFSTPTERYVTIRRLLQALAQERPVAVWLDDVHHGLDALRFAVYLLDYPARQRLPVLLVLTATEELLERRTEEENVLAELLEHDRSTRIPVGPLPEADRIPLVRGVLGLEPGLARAVEERTAGNPLFVVQLVDDWVRRGLLAASPDGFRLADDEPLPRDVSDLWARRVSRLLEELDEEEAHALELAAVLGSEVDPAEWAAACGRSPGADPSGPLLEDLLHRRLAISGPDGPGAGWSFAHESLRTALEQRAEAQGRLARWHRTCAEVLEDRGRVRASSGAAAWSERLGRHWLGARQPSRALPHLERAARDRIASGDFSVAEELVGLWQGALGQVGAKPGDPRHGDVWLLRHEILSRRGDWDGADRLLAAATEEARAHGWSGAMGRLLCQQARQARIRGHHDEALETLTAVEADAVARGDRGLGATSRLEIGECLMGAGEVVEAQRWARLSLQDAEAAGDAEATAEAWLVLGECAHELGQHVEAARLLRKAEVLFERLGHRWKRADALNSQGDVARAQGELDQAVVLYRRARGLLKAIGSRSWVIPEYNTGLVHLARSDVERATPVLELAMQTFIEQGNRNALANAHLALASCAAASEAWLLFDDHVREAATLLTETGFSDEDTALAAVRAGDWAAERDQPERSRTARRLALTLWSALGRRKEVEDLERLLGRRRGRG